MTIAARRDECSRSASSPGVLAVAPPAPVARGTGTRALALEVLAVAPSAPVARRDECGRSASFLGVLAVAHPAPATGRNEHARAGGVSRGSLRAGSTDLGLSFFPSPPLLLPIRFLTSLHLWKALRGAVWNALSCDGENHANLARSTGRLAVFAVPHGPRPRASDSAELARALGLPLLDLHGRRSGVSRRAVRCQPSSDEQGHPLFRGVSTKVAF